ncbi:transposase [Methylobacterium sp. M6A4_1b]
MTIPGTSSVVASTVLASIGEITRFPTPDRLSSYNGRIQRVRLAGKHPARQDLEARRR